MTTKGKTGVVEHQTKDADSILISKGATKNQLATIFRKSSVDISAKLMGLEPSGTSKLGFPLYSIAEAARRLVSPPDDDVIRVIQRMSPDKLPVKLQKTIWEASLARLKYEQEAGQLFRAQDIAMAFNDVFKLIRSQLTGMSDAIARERNITSEQRDLINAITDETLEGIAEILVNDERLAGYQSALELYEQEGVDLDSDVGGDE